MISNYNWTTYCPHGEYMQSGLDLQGWRCSCCKKPTLGTMVCGKCRYPAFAANKQPVPLYPEGTVHCWEEGPTHPSGHETTCLLQDHPDQPHRHLWWRNDQVKLQGLPARISGETKNLPFPKKLTFVARILLKLSHLLHRLSK